MDRTLGEGVATHGTEAHTLDAVLDAFPAEEMPAQCTGHVPDTLQANLGGV